MTTHTASRACYLRGCKQNACEQANYRYMKQLRLERERGQRRRQDATQTRVHIERLLAAGWTQAQISRAAGLAHRTIGAITAGCPTVANATARAVLAVRLGPAPDDHRDVDATGTARRIRALVAIGWSITQLADQFGMTDSALGNIARGQLQNVRATTAETVAAEYRALSRTPGPSQRARNLARRYGWHSPLAWDDIDNPDARPEPCPPEQELDRLQLGAYRRQEIAHLAAYNVPEHEIADRLGMGRTYVHDLITAMNTRRRNDLEEAA